MKNKKFIFFYGPEPFMDAFCMLENIYFLETNCYLAGWILSFKNPLLIYKAKKSGARQSKMVKTLGQSDKWFKSYDQNT